MEDITKMTLGVGFMIKKIQIMDVLINFAHKDFDQTNIGNYHRAWKDDSSNLYHLLVVQVNQTYLRDTFP